MNLLAKRENEVPAELEKVFPGVDELVRNFFGRFLEPGSGLLRGSVFDSRWETEVTDKEVIVKISAPGCHSGDFDVELVGDFLTFKIHRSEEKKEKCASRRFIFRERSCADYEESIKLPVPVRGGDAKARYAHGVVTISLPRDLQEVKRAEMIKVHCDK